MLSVSAMTLISHFLKPGDYVCGKQNNLHIATVLGSCVSVVLWHPTKNIFAMCHYLLTQSNAGATDLQNIGRYGSLVLPAMFAYCRQGGVSLQEFDVRLFGGAASCHSQKLPAQYLVGHNNVELAEQLLEQNNMTILQQDTGGFLGRKLCFDTQSGQCVLYYLNGIQP